MKRRVVYFTDTIAFGGAELAMLHLIEGLDRERWEPLLLHHDSPGIAPLLERARRAGVLVQSVPALPLGHRGALAAPHFAHVLRRIRPSVFHAHLTWPLACKYPLLMAALAGIPAVVATLHLFVELPYDRLSRIQQRLLAARLGRYIAVSHHVARRVHDVFGVAWRRLRVIHNAVPAAPFTAGPDAALRARLTGGNHRQTVLTCARLDAQKGLSYLLEAAALLPEVSVAVAGDGPQRDALVARAHALNVAHRVHFLGHRDDIPALMATSDVFVLPSLFEGLPLSILEAMSAHKPVVATAVGGIPEVVRDGETGLLVPPRDPAALAEAIRRVIADAALAHRLAAAGYRRVSCEFSVTHMVRGVTDTYDELLHARA